MRETGLYDPQNEHDSCGVGCVCRLDGASSHALVSDSLRLLINLTHRGAAGADADSGDGAGIIIRIPDRFFRKVFPQGLPPHGEYGLGMFFLPLDPSSAQRARELVENQAGLLGWRIHAWREVPTDESKVGRYASRNRPSVWQAAFIEPGRGDGDQDAFERRLYVLRKSVETKAQAAGFSLDDFYVPSLSSRTIVYKGMMYAAQLEGFYPELADPLV
ncbi:MAG: glutamate synthase subunit alpha, partial [Deltaproteobacteria bacterium]|nr:glutamate synthase subunit alpha [Deltaproteobacteria bacterium]